MALAVKRNLREIPGHFAKVCRRTEIAQCSKCDQKGNLHRESKRQSDGSKHQSVALGPIDEEYWAALTHAKTEGILLHSGCTDRSDKH